MQINNFDNRPVFREKQIGGDTDFPSNLYFRGRGNAEQRTENREQREIH